MCLPLRKHGHRVAEGAHLAQAMGDEHDRHALGALVGDDVAEPVDVAAGERRGRLVEQQDARLAEQRARDLDLLLDGEVEFADLVVEARRRRCRARRNARRPAPRAWRRRIMPAGPTGRRAAACCRAR